MKSLKRKQYESRNITSKAKTSLPAFSGSTFGVNTLNAQNRGPSSPPGPVPTNPVGLLLDERPAHEDGPAEA